MNKQTEVGKITQLLPRIAIIAPQKIILELIVKIINSGYMPINQINGKLHLSDLHTAECFYATQFSNDVILMDYVMQCHLQGKMRISKINFEYV